jgi:pyruvate dehydrogenase E2 component (dihydrolipoamide acetyltransferase)
MPLAITMPALSDTMNNGRLVKWTLRIGDKVSKGQTIAEIETDKAVMEVEAFHDGYLAGPLAAVDSEIPVGQVIGYIAESPVAEIAIAAPAAPAAAAAPAAPVPPIPPVAVPPASGVRASPYARRLAQQLGVDVADLSSRQGEVHADAILAAARRAPAADLDAGPPYRIERVSSLRESLARTMAASAATPVFRVTARLPLGPLKLTAKAAQVSLTLLLARASALSVTAHPLFNAVYTPEGFARRERVDVGIAVDTAEGLIAPVLRDVAGRKLADLAADWAGLRDRVNSRRLVPEDYRGATFYLSNLGQFPVVDSFDAVLPQGAAAILCVAGAGAERASFTLGCDHRVLAGADAARFLQTLAEFLTDPGTLLGAPD